VGCTAASQPVRSQSRHQYRHSTRLYRLKPPLSCEPAPPLTPLLPENIGEQPPTPNYLIRTWVKTDCFDGIFEAPEVVQTQKQEDFVINSRLGLPQDRLLSCLFSFFRSFSVLRYFLEWFKAEPPQLQKIELNSRLPRLLPLV